MKISIIIPAYNEEKRIGKTLEEYCKFFQNKKIKKVIEDFEIIVVLNACRDKTLEVVKKAEKHFKEISHLEFERAGKGFAIIGGFKDALKRDSSLIGFVDADNATNPSACYDLIQNLGGYDGIIASRYINNARVVPPPSLSRIIASRIFNFLVRAVLFMPYKDTQCGAKFFRREAIKEIIPLIGITKWAFDVDLLYQMRKNKFRLREYPTVWSDQNYSKINLKAAGPQMFLAIVRLRLLNSPARGLIRLYNDYTK